MYQIWNIGINTYLRDNDIAQPKESQAEYNYTINLVFSLFNLHSRCQHKIATSIGSTNDSYTAMPSASHTSWRGSQLEIEDVCNSPTQHATQWKASTDPPELALAFGTGGRLAKASQSGKTLACGTPLDELGVLEGVMCGTGIDEKGVVEGKAIGVASLFTKVGMGVLDGPGVWLDGTTWLLSGPRTLRRSRGDWAAALLLRAVRVDRVRRMLKCIFGWFV